MTTEKFTHFIIVDKDGKPMAWNQDQLCYCTDQYWQDDHHPVRVYKKATAMKLIAKTIKFRIEGKMNPGVYKLMPVYKTNQP